MAHSNMVNSVLKAIDILHAVAGAESGIRLNDLVDRFGIKKTTAHNLVRTLRARNFITKGRGNRYHLGPAVPELLHLQQSSELHRQAEFVLMNLHRRWPRATLTFSENCDGEILIRVRVSEQQPGFLQKPTAQTLPPYVSASSLSLLAFDADYRRVVTDRFPFETYAKNHWATRNELEDELDRIQSRGMAIIPHEDNRYSVAVPVASRYTLGVYFRQEVDDVVEYAREILTHAAAQIADVS